MRNIDEVLNRVAARRPRVIDLSLDRVHAALARMGDPHKKLPPIIHVAGTNGKGSTVSMMRSVLEAADKRVHVYTSPHLVRFNERIVLAGKEITDAQLIAALEQCDQAVGEEKLTYFETITCAAFLAFSQTPADVLLLEVGLGGRLDATNVIEKSIASVITPIDLDHQQFLGDEITLVAAEKAGIFRQKTPAVIGPQSPEAMEVLEREAMRMRAPLFAHGQHWHVYAEHGRLIYQDESGLSDLDMPALEGRHQIDNAGLAVAALKAAGFALSNEVLSIGLASAHWPARLQRLTRGPLIELARAMLGEEPEIWLDGGHNPHGGRALAQAMADMEERRPKPLVMISGMQANKDAVGYFTPFKGLASAVYAVAANHDAVASPQEVEAAAREAGLYAHLSRGVAHALRMALADIKNEPPRILISGSLYLAGEILRDHG
ncbi:MAG: bifunctional folylpolyglutamate synthase/dihydrofolate synthase [Hyphococcus sp.]|nr:MAG: bifunctional folylpolyglutamate synthase/dihydrofolate synthase [Marinicaulis sp.]